MENLSKLLRRRASSVEAPAAESVPDEAPGRLPLGRPIAVIDIGSNSVRLVVYEGLVRSPTPIFNEKVLCGLGREVASKRHPRQGCDRGSAFGARALPRAMQGDAGRARARDRDRGGARSEKRPGLHQGRGVGLRRCDRCSAGAAGGAACRRRRCRRFLQARRHRRRSRRRLARTRGSRGRSQQERPDLALGRALARRQRRSLARQGEENRPLRAGR